MIGTRKVLVVEDHPLVAAATLSLFQTLALGPVTLCRCADEAMALFDAEPDWFRVFLDVGVPGAQGLSLIRHAHRRGLAPRSVVVTASQNPAWRTEIEAMGFLGCILKTADIRAFNASMQAVIDGQPCFDAIDPKPGAQPARLTRRQAEIASLIEAGLGALQIAERLRVPLPAVQNQLSALFHTLRSHGDERAARVATELHRIP